MNQSNFKRMLHNSTLIVSSLVLQGCFESTSPSSTPSTTQQPSTPSQKPTPLSNVSNVNFRIPEGTTRIISSYEQRETNNWSDARNWRSGFYRNSELLACGDYNYVPCMQKAPYIPHSITIKGECFANGSVDLQSLSLSKSAILIIPKGVCVKLDTSLCNPSGKHIIDGVLKASFIDMLGNSKATFSGEGTLEILGNSDCSAHLSGTITVANLIMPGVRVSPLSVLKGNENEKLQLNIQNGCFSHLHADSICVSNRLDIGFILIRKGHNDDLRVNHLNVRETGMIIFGRRSNPYSIQKLSFESKAKICFEFLLLKSDNFDESDQWIPRRITGILDATNLRVASYPEFKALEPKGGGKAIGGRVDLLIAEQGVIGTSDWLKEQNRRTIVGITNPRNSEEFKPGSTHYLLRTDDRALYATALTGAGSSLFSGDHTYQQLKNDYPNVDHNEHLGVNHEQYRELNKVCEALSSQAESIYKNATDAGIERYLDIQLTVDLKERAQKVLGLIDISKYLDQRNDVNQAGLQAVSDIFAKARVTHNPFGQGITVVEIPLHGLASSRSGGIVFSGKDTRITLALHNSNERHSLPIIGLALNNRISAKWDGLFQCIGSSIQESHRSFTMSGGTLYKASPTLQISAVVGGSYFGGEIDSPRADEATSRSSMGSLRSEFQLLLNMGDHHVNSAVNVDYLPVQTIAVNIPGFGITIDDTKIVDQWNATMRLGYSYSITEGAELSGNLQFNLGHAHTLSGNIGVAFNR